MKNNDRFSNLTTGLENILKEGARQLLQQAIETGIDAGQTVKHWHLHVIFSVNKAQDFWGRITVIKNILLGSSPMKRDELAKKVSELREELAVL